MFERPLVRDNGGVVRGTRLRGRSGFETRGTSALTNGRRRRTLRTIPLRESIYRCVRGEQKRDGIVVL